MKKIIALFLAAMMCFSLVACGGDKETGNNSGTLTNENNSQQETKSVVSNEEMAGIWLSADNISFEINTDGTVINKSRGQNITFSQNEQYVPWKVEGNNFIFQESMGSILKFEIIKDNDLLKLKYLEMDGGFVAGIVVEEFMTELTKQSDN